MDALYERYTREKPRYVQVRNFRGVICTPGQFADFWQYCRNVQDLNPGRRVPMCLFYPSCVGEEGAGRAEERISLIAPAPDIYPQASVHFVMMRPSLDEMGIHYQRDMTAFAQQRGVRSEYYDNARDDKLFPDLQASLKGFFPEWMLSLPPSEEVLKKYQSDTAFYGRLRHLGAITREQLENLFHFLKHRGGTGTPYCYYSSADPALVSVNVPSPTEGRDIFINISVPLDAVGDVLAFTQECARRSIEIHIAPRLQPDPREP